MCGIASFSGLQASFGSHVKRTAFLHIAARKTGKPGDEANVNLQHLVGYIDILMCAIYPRSQSFQLGLVPMHAKCGCRTFCVTAERS